MSNSNEYVTKAQAIKAAMDGADDWDGGPNSTRNTCISDAISAIPPADVRPVVLCRDCEYWFDNGTDFASCERDALMREAGFFCADGKRRGADMREAP